MPAVANDSPEWLGRAGIDPAEAAGKLWAWDPGSGARWSGAGAVNRILAELGDPYRRLALPYRWPPVAAAEEGIYRWVARNRHRLARFWAA